MEEITGKWVIETVLPDLAIMLRVDDVLYSGHTGFQRVEVVHSDVYGRSLLLDGKTQSTERDEHIYHETLVHPAMTMHPQPRHVFIGGGGEGGTLREVLAHRSVENVVMVDLDQQVVELCREHLPQHHQGAFDDPRTELIFGDARKYLETSNQQFDVMIMDLVDPLEGGPAYLLYTEEYYEIARARLKPGGILVTQSGPAGYLSLRECFTTIFKTLDQIFAHAAPCHTHVPSFITLWGFTVASDAQLPNMSPAEVDKRIAERITKPLRHYDGETHAAMFTLPRHIRDGIAEETRINRDDAPVFMV
jgi:spermidine synthase